MKHCRFAEPTMEIIDRVHTLPTAAVHDSEAPSQNGASISLSPFEIQGQIETFERGWIHGWAWAPELPEQVVVVEAVMEGEVLAATLACLYRPDLPAWGIGNE